MSARDWFRKKTWSPSDQEDFFARLKRSRGFFKKAQYLRIQACELQNAGSEDLYRAALELLEKLFAEYPDESQLAQAYSQQGDCLKGLGLFDAALAAFRKAMDIQRLKPGWATSAYRSFAWLVATRPFPLCYDEALAALEEFGERESFPVEEYESSGSRALIDAAKSEPELARSWARTAMVSASKGSSGFRYHSELGLAHDPDAVVYRKLRRLAA